ADEVRLLDLQMIEQPHDILGHLLAVQLGIAGLAAAAVTAAVHADDLIGLGQRPGDAWELPLQIAVEGEAMEQYHRHTLSLDDGVDLHAARVEKAVGGTEGARGEGQQTGNDIQSKKTKHSGHSSTTDRSNRVCVCIMPAAGHQGQEDLAGWGCAIRGANAPELPIQRL